jgi:Isochorismatase family
MLRKCWHRTRKTCAFSNPSIRASIPPLCSITDMCVFTTATDACMLGYQVAVPSDCTASVTAERKSAALAQLKTAFGCSTAKGR